MPHVRLNERETNPNPHINFISALPVVDSVAEEEARQMLRALAAQIRPIMKSHGFAVNSFEEYEFNKVFAGRNWNNGEVVEIVLRGASGRFLPTSWLIGTLCHELAHIKHMNHGSAFQALWAQLRREVRELQNKGYYGDGYWSSGTRLADSTTVGGLDLDHTELPEYMCGGAQARTRPSSLQRRVSRQPVGPSNRTGAQTSKKRKAGTRVTIQGIFIGEGQALSADVSGEKGSVGTGFRKKAASKRAREERAQAAEQHLQTLLRKPAGSIVEPSGGLDPDDGSHESDQDRRQQMFDMVGQAELKTLKFSITDFSNDFVLPPSNGDRPGSAEMNQGQHIPLSDIHQTRKACAPVGLPSSSGSRSMDDPTEREHPQKRRKGLTSSGPVVQQQKEAPVVTGTGRTHSAETSSTRNTIQTTLELKGAGITIQSSQMNEWPCLVCTLSNNPMHLACAACGTRRGELHWKGA